MVCTKASKVPLVERERRERQKKEEGKPLGLKGERGEIWIITSYWRKKLVVERKWDWWFSKAVGLFLKFHISCVL